MASWTKLTKEIDNGYGWGDQAWGSSPWGGGDSIWTKLTKVTNTWTKLIKAS